jgi:hypothetical protein
MAAPILEVDIMHPQPRQVERAVKVLEAGGLIAYPTDTYYGLGCDLGSKKAVDRLYALKGRDRKKPFSFLCPDLSDVATYAHVSNFAYRLMKQFTPGPFTFVLEATRLTPEMMQIVQQKLVNPTQLAEQQMQIPPATTTELMKHFLKMRSSIPSMHYMLRLACLGEWKIPETISVTEEVYNSLLPLTGCIYRLLCQEFSVYIRITIPRTTLGRAGVGHPGCARDIMVKL